MRHQRGFTLLEMLLAISLLVLLAGLAYGTLRIGVRGWETAGSHAEQGDAMRVAWPFLHQSLEDTRPLHDEQGQPLFSGAAKALRWAAELPAHLAGGGAQQLWLRSEQPPDQPWPRLVLSYQDPAGNAPATTGDPARRATLVERLAGLTIRYFGTPPQGGAAVWQDSWQERKALPVLVRIDIRPADGPPWPSLYAHPRLAGGIAASADPRQFDPESEEERGD